WTCPVPRSDASGTGPTEDGAVPAPRGGGRTAPASAHPPGGAGPLRTSLDGGRSGGMPLRRGLSATGRRRSAGFAGPDGTASASAPDATAGFAAAGSAGAGGGDAAEGSGSQRCASSPAGSSASEESPVSQSSSGSAMLSQSASSAPVSTGSTYSGPGGPACSSGSSRPRAPAACRIALPPLEGTRLGRPPPSGAGPAGAGSGR